MSAQVVNNGKKMRNKYYTQCLHYAIILHQCGATKDPHTDLQYKVKIMTRLTE